MSDDDSVAVGTKGNCTDPETDCTTMFDDNRLVVGTKGGCAAPGEDCIVVFPSQETYQSVPSALVPTVAINTSDTAEASPVADFRDMQAYTHVLDDSDPTVDPSHNTHLADGVNDVKHHSVSPFDPGLDKHLNPSVDARMASPDNDLFEQASDSAIPSTHLAEHGKFRSKLRMIPATITKRTTQFYQWLQVDHHRKQFCTRAHAAHAILCSNVRSALSLEALDESLKFPDGEESAKPIKEAVTSPRTLSVLDD